MSDRKGGLLPPGMCSVAPAGLSASLRRGSESPVSTDVGGRGGTSWGCWGYMWGQKKDGRGRMHLGGAGRADRLPRRSRWALSEKTRRNHPGSLHLKALPRDSSTLLSKKRCQSSISSSKVASGRYWEDGRGSGWGEDVPDPHLLEGGFNPPSWPCATFLKSAQIKKPAPRFRKGIPRARSSPAT